MLLEDQVLFAGAELAALEKGPCVSKHSRCSSAGLTQNKAAKRSEVERPVPPADPDLLPTPTETPTSG